MNKYFTLFLSLLSYITIKSTQHKIKCSDFFSSCSRSAIRLQKSLPFLRDLDLATSAHKTPTTPASGRTVVSHVVLDLFQSLGMAECQERRCGIIRTVKGGECRRSAALLILRNRLAPGEVTITTETVFQAVKVARPRSGPSVLAADRGTKAPVAPLMPKAWRLTASVVGRDRLLIAGAPATINSLVS